MILASFIIQDLPAGQEDAAEYILEDDYFEVDWPDISNPARIAVHPVRGGFVKVKQGNDPSTLTLTGRYYPLGLGPVFRRQGDYEVSVGATRPRLRSWRRVLDFIRGRNITLFVGNEIFGDMDVQDTNMSPEGEDVPRVGILQGLEDAWRPASLSWSITCLMDAPGIAPRWVR